MRIGIANDLPIATQLLRRVVLLRPDTTVVWTARDGAEAIAMCAKDTPDLILMDLIMPITDGVQATKQIMAKTPCAILIVTTSIDINADKVFEAMGYGALDAVDTPVLGAQDLRESAKPLLALVDRVAQMNASRTQRLVAKPAPRRPREPAYNGRMVAIGASAGGPAALAQLLAGLPKDFPAAIVIVQRCVATPKSGSPPSTREAARSFMPGSRSIPGPRRPKSGLTTRPGANSTKRCSTTSSRSTRAPNRAHTS